MTSRRSDASSERALDDRLSEVLRTVIREHIQHGEPVGSRTVSRGARLELSPASIRNLMAELEERGLLSQPHTSAGRVPTDQAYRFYVDRMIGQPRMTSRQADAIDRALRGTAPELQELLGAVSRQLSEFSRQVGVVLAPELGRLVVDRLEFVRLDARRVVAILVGSTGVVHNRTLELKTPLDQPELDRIGNYLSMEFGGRTLPEMRERLRQCMSEEGADYDRLMRRSLELGQRALQAGHSEAGMFVEGASNLLGAPEFADVEAMRGLLKTLEEKRRLVSLLTEMIEGDGVQVVIGEENPLSDLARCSVVATTYSVGGQVLGTLGIVGPTRMEYARAIAIVEHLARALPRLLAPSEN